MRRVPVLLAVLATVVLAGCGGTGSKNTDSAKDFSGEQKAVATTIEDLQAAAKDRKGAEICADLITAELRDAISQTDCPKTVKDAIRDTDQADLTVKSVTITGDKAVAQVQEKLGDNKKRTATLKLEKAAGRWRIAELPQS